ncbi:hypothetical protein [Bradyrhizobium liaoningense]|nr:hypothetical protein GCM10007858_25550 [Bradyrhizobium liaoningense]
MQCDEISEISLAQSFGGQSFGDEAIDGARWTHFEKVAIAERADDTIMPLFCPTMQADLGKSVSHCFHGSRLLCMGLFSRF